MIRKLPGFTLVEAMVVVSVFGILAGITTINLIRPQTKVSLDTTATTLAADIKDQQLKSMLGYTDGQSTAQNFGIYLESTRYTLFRGSSYSLGASGNYVVTLEGGTTISNITFASSTILFTKLSGDVSSFSSTNNTFKVVARDGNSKTFTINRYGAITIT